jgi:quinone-modifying oxidoreductase subunit QmoC
MLQAQWGLEERLLGDSAVWLCHQCNDCSTRCPRDAKPGDVVHTVRALSVESMAVPRFMGSLVAKAGVTWPLLIGVPILFWVVLLALTSGLGLPEAPFAYDEFVPHSLIYMVNFTATALVGLSMWISGRRFWNRIGEGEKRSGTFLGQLVAASVEILTHRRFGSCSTARPRRIGHLTLVWGFIGAAVTSGLLVIWMYGLGWDLPVRQGHWIKILGNISAALLVVGGAVLVWGRLKKNGALGRTTAFDSFFLTVVVLVIVTGVLIEVLRLADAVALGCWIYVLHLGVVLCLFLTLPYSKFAHLLYRTLAMVHERMTASVLPEASSKPASVRSLSPS